MAVTAGAPSSASQDTVAQLVDAVARGQLVGPREPTERGSRRVVVHRRSRAGHRGSGAIGLAGDPAPGTIAGRGARSPDRRARAPAAAPERGRLRWPDDDRPRRFMDMLSRVLPGRGRRGPVRGGRRACTSPSSCIASTMSAPGLYLLPRDPLAIDRLRAACRPDFAVGSGRRSACRSGDSQPPMPAARGVASAATRTSRPTASSASGCWPTSTRA